VDTRFSASDWHQGLEDDWQAILALAFREDLGQAGDLTTDALVPPDAPGRAAVVARRAGVAAGTPGVTLTLERFDPELRWRPECRDGDRLHPGRRLGIIEGPARAILSAERILLNFLGRLSGIATLTRRYVEAVEGTRARIYDTRKTTPGWRRLEKYAVRCGGGENHRMGLYDAVLIKDNHLALGAAPPESGGSAADPAKSGPGKYGPAEAIAHAKRYVAKLAKKGGVSRSRSAKSGTARSGGPAVVEIEVDTLDQLDAVLPAGPDGVLLDNFSVANLRATDTWRDSVAPSVFLEASGGVNLDTVREIALTGIDRISVGALSHSAAWLDLGLDWL